MNIYENVKTVVTTRQAAERYGLEVRRNGMTCCPFHDDRHPSMKVDERYYCFGCQETGDVIDFTANLFGLGSYEAACKLSADFVISPSVMTRRPPKVSPDKQYRQDEQLCFDALSAYLRLLRDWKTQYAPATPEDKLNDRFVEACRMMDYVEYLVDVFITDGMDERLSTVCDLTNGNRLQELRNRIDRMRQEGEQQRDRDCYDIAV